MTNVNENQNAWRLDVSADKTTWYQVEGITDGNFPGITPNTKDTSSYDNNGWGTSAVMSNSGSLEITAFTRVDRDTGVKTMSLQLINQCLGETGAKATLYARWGRTDGHTPYEGWTGLVSVAKGSGNTAWDDPRTSKITLSAAEALTKMTAAPSEWSSAAVPQIASITPAGAAVDELVFIEGSGFTGVAADGVAFGSTDSTNAEVKTDSLLAVSVPTGASGTVSVVVTNQTGDSNPVSYTVGT